MEKQIENNELSQPELQTVIGGGKVEMMGDTWVANGDGHPQQTTHHWAWPLSLVLG